MIDFVVRLIFWLVFVLLGLFPVFLAVVRGWFASDRLGSFDPDELYRDGSLLFFGPAVLMVTLGELVLKYVDVDYASLLMVAVPTLITVLLAVSSFLYSDLFRAARRKAVTQSSGGPQDEGDSDFILDMHLIRHLVWALTISALILSFSLTAVFNWKVHAQKRLQHEPVSSSCSAAPRPAEPIGTSEESQTSADHKSQH